MAEQNETPGGEAAGQGAAPNPNAEKAKEWMAQLEAMIAGIAKEAAPVARQVGAKAAELAALAAVKAGPIAQKVAEVTTEQGQKFAEKAQAVAAELRHQEAAAEAPTEEPAPAADPEAAEGSGI